MGTWTWFVQPKGRRLSTTEWAGVSRSSRWIELSGGRRAVGNRSGLTFDSQWNLFTNDNDHESLPADYVPGRLIT